MTDRDTADIDREIGHAFHLLGRLFMMRADAAGRVAPTLPDVAFLVAKPVGEMATVAGDEERARPERVWCSECNERPATHHLPASSVSLCDACNPPDSHPFASPIPAAAPAVDGLPVCRDNGRSEPTCGVWNGRVMSLSVEDWRALPNRCPACVASPHWTDRLLPVPDAVAAPAVEQTTLADAVRTRTGCLACVEVARSGGAGGIAHTCEAIPFGEPVADVRVAVSPEAVDDVLREAMAQDRETDDRIRAVHPVTPLDVGIRATVAEHFAGKRRRKPAAETREAWSRLVRDLLLAMPIDRKDNRTIGGMPVCRVADDRWYDMTDEAEGDVLWMIDRIGRGNAGAMADRKPAAPWEPSSTSIARANLPAGHVPATVSAYLAACPARHVKPGDRDFVRWYREASTKMDAAKAASLP